jgi:hypothetical protein
MDGSRRAWKESCVVFVQGIRGRDDGRRSAAILALNLKGRDLIGTRIVRRRKGLSGRLIRVTYVSGLSLTRTVTSMMGIERRRISLGRMSSYVVRVMGVRGVLRRILERRVRGRARRLIEVLTSSSSSFL